MGMRSDLSGGISLTTTAAASRARELAGLPYRGARAAPPRAPRRVRVIGDPQTSLDRFLEVLSAHELLTVDGWLADDVQLVSIGDHFDYRVHDESDPGEDGVAILRWLAEHHPSQVVLLVGNHDAARVMELITLSDARFAEARAAAARLAPLERSAPEEYARRWRDEVAPAYPGMVTPGLFARDYASYGEAQRDLVMTLLSAGRMRLGVAARLPDARTALLTHAGVTRREVDHLGAEIGPVELAAALDRRLAAAVEARRADWAAGRRVPLDLSPLHVAGAQPHEGGGLLYHRPSNPARASTPSDPVDVAWESDPRRRRYHPRELPAGLVQVVGHTHHTKCKQELRGWLAPDAEALTHGGLRTLIADGPTLDDVRYHAGVLAAPRTAATMVMIDAEINDLERPADEVPLLELMAVLA